jgi:D-alanyl-lipoteichoic acid acyltransferase DltB (MBOAT superfamily)
MRTIRPLDYLLAAVMTAGGVFLMWENIAAGNSDDLIHPPSTTSWAIVPVFLLVTVPILWRRSNIAAVSGITAAAAIIHVLAFGWLTRCGVVLPLALALAYATARFSKGRQSILSLAAIVVLLVVTLLRDSSADLAGALPIALPGVALFFGAGLLINNRMSVRHERVIEGAQP